MGLMIGNPYINALLIALIVALPMASRAIDKKWPRKPQPGDVTLKGVKDAVSNFDFGALVAFVVIAGILATMAMIAWKVVRWAWA